MPPLIMYKSMPHATCCYQKENVFNAISPTNDSKQTIFVGADEISAIRIVIHGILLKS